MKSDFVAILGLAVVIAFASFPVHGGPCRALNPIKTIEMQDRQLAGQMRSNIFQLVNSDRSLRSGTATLVSIDGDTGYFLTVWHNFEGKPGFTINSNGRPKASVDLVSGHAIYSVVEVWYDAPSTSTAAIVDIAIVKATKQSGDSPLSPVELAIGWGLNDARDDPVPSLLIVGHWISGPPEDQPRTPKAMFQKFATSDDELKTIFMKPPVPALKPLDALIVGLTESNAVRSGDSGSIAYDAQGYGLGLLTSVYPKAWASKGETFDVAVMIPMSAKQLRVMLAKIPPTVKSKQMVAVLQAAAASTNIPRDSLSTLEWFMVINEIRKSGIPSAESLSILLRAALCRPLSLQILEVMKEINGIVTSKKLNPETNAELAKTMVKVIGEIELRNASIKGAAVNLAMAGFEAYVAQSVGRSPTTSAAYFAQSLTDYSLFLTKASESTIGNDRVRLEKRALEIAKSANKVSPRSPEPYDIASYIHQKSGNYSKAAVATLWKIEGMKPYTKVQSKDVADLQFLTSKAVGAPGMVTCDTTLKCVGATVSDNEIAAAFKRNSRESIFIIK